MKMTRLEPNRAGRLARLLPICLLAAAALLSSGCIVVPIGGSGRMELPRQRTIRPSDDFFSPGKVLVVRVTGEIASAGSAGVLSLGETLGMPARIGEELRQARGDDEIKAVLLVIDSPGGGVTASDVIYRELLAYKTEQKVPVHAIMLDVAASGGYYVAMAADEISAHPTTITGSIGVIASFPLVQKLADWAGYEQRDITSGPNKAIGSLFRPFTPEQERILQALVDSMYERFLAVIKEGRPKLAEEKLRQLADGRIYTADQARDHGLIDHVEDIPALLARLDEKLGGSAEIVTYDAAYGRDSSLYRVNAPAAASGDTLGALLGGGVPARIDVRHGVAGVGERQPGFYYLWLP